MIKAIPTTYSNARFRSRLEAKWAAFFDLCGWRWEYEPLDLDGWVPDFGMVGHNGLILVEVKPIEWTEDWQKNHELIYRVRDRELRSDLVKCRNAGEREVLILGAYPFRLGNELSSYLGMIFYSGIRNQERYYDSELDYAVFNHETYYNGKLDFRAGNGRWDERISGRYDGDKYVQEVEISRIDALWRQASSLVQWNAKG